MKIITTSWDDGTRESLQIAELLRDQGTKGTFYVPVSPLKGKKAQNLDYEESFLDDKDLKKLSKDFEIGGHGVTHKYLTSLSKKEIEDEVKNSKKFLENVIKENIHGFAYPGGKYNKLVREEVKKAGFSYARTVKDGALNPHNKFSLPVTLFCNDTYVSRLKFTFMSPFSKVYSFGGKWENCILKAYKNLKRDGGVLHIAGHPQDLSQPGFKDKLERIFSKISGSPEIEYLTNHETIQRLEEEGRLK